MQYTSQESTLIAFRNSVKLHNIAGIILLINYLAFIIGNSFTTNGNHYRIVFKGLLSSLMIQLKYYTVDMFKGKPEPYPITESSKFNPIQRATYVFVMFIICPLIILSGLLMLFPEKVSGSFLGLEKYFLIDLVHVSTGFIVSLFLVIHIYFSTISHDKLLSRYKSIITGYHEEK
jgi:thiosulfate reductase cytochrome b subunit